MDARCRVAGNVHRIVARWPNLRELLWRPGLGSQDVATTEGVLALEGLPHLHTLSLSRCEALTNDVSSALHARPPTQLYRRRAHATHAIPTPRISTHQPPRPSGLQSPRNSGVSSTAPVLFAHGNETPLSVTDSAPALPPPQVVDRLTRSLPALTDLDLSWCNRVGDAALAAVTARLTNLTTLHLRRCKSVSDTGIRTLAELPSLATLSLDGCTKLTGAATGAFALKGLKDGCTLTDLDLRDCTCVPAWCQRSHDLSPPTRAVAAPTWSGPSRCTCSASHTKRSASLYVSAELLFHA
jgi:hypothetical protein